MKLTRLHSAIAAVPGVFAVHTVSQTEDEIVVAAEYRQDLFTVPANGLMRPHPSLNLRSLGQKARFAGLSVYPKAKVKYRGPKAKYDDHTREYVGHESLTGTLTITT